MTEREAVAKIERTLPIIESDRARFAVPLRPEAGSPLAVDDLVWPSSPLSQHVHTCLASAWDHFDLVGLTIAQRRTYATATNSVIRSALLASSEALWMLTPDDPAERQERGLTFAQEWYTRRIQWQKEVTPDLSEADQVRSHEQLAFLSGHLEAVKALRTSAATLDATNVIRLAGKATFPHPRQQREVVREWRRMGGDAHGLGWPFMLGNQTWGSKGDDGLTEAFVTGNLVSLANGYLAAWLIYREAIKRLDVLANGSNSSNT